MQFRQTVFLIFGVCAASAHASFASSASSAVMASRALGRTAISAVQTAPDDSGWINSGILDAIAHGLPEYNIPAGNYQIINPIIIPAGTRNFALKGAGISQTRFTTPSGKANQIVRVGSLFNQYRKVNPINLASSVKEGDPDILIPNGVSVETGKYYVLEDSYTISSSQDVSVSRPRFELVRFTAFSPSTRRAVLENPAAREYDHTPRITPVDSYVSKNITVQGMGMNGSLPGTTTNASDRIVYAWMVDGLTLRDLDVNTFQSAALEVEESRNVSMDNIHVAHAVDLGPGQGYGVIGKHCRFFYVQNSTADGCRHGFILHSGTTDAAFTNCDATGAFSNLDLHGYDERRVVFQNCSSSNSINIGNDKWLAGEKDIKIINCSLGGPIVLCPNARNIRVVGTDLWGFKLTSSTDSGSNPPGGYADKIFFENCYFRADSGVITKESNQIGTISFTRCTFEEVPTTWGTLFLISQIANGSMLFDHCKFIVNSSRAADVGISLQTTSPNFEIQVRSSTFIHKGGGLCAVGTSATYGGKTSLIGNRFLTYGAKSKPVFYKNLGTGKAFVSGNAAQKAN